MTPTDAELRDLVARARRYGRRLGKNIGIGADEGESIAVCSLVEALRTWRPGGAPLASWCVGVGTRRILDERRRLLGARRSAPVVFRSFEPWMSRARSFNAAPVRLELADVFRVLDPTERALIQTLATGERMDRAVPGMSQTTACRTRALLIDHIRARAS